MQQNIGTFIVNPNEIDIYFKDFKNKSPHNIKRSIKSLMKEYHEMDEENYIFYLLNLYKTSDGKDNLTSEENKKVRKFCDEYAESI